MQPVEITPKDRDFMALVGIQCDEPQARYVDELQDRSRFLGEAAQKWCQEAQAMSEKRRFWRILAIGSWAVAVGWLTGWWLTR